MSELDFMILDSESTLNDIDIERMQSLTCRANDIPLGTISAIPEPKTEHRKPFTPTPRPPSLYWGIYSRLPLLVSGILRME